MTPSLHPLLSLLPRSLAAGDVPIGVLSQNFISKSCYRKVNFAEAMLNFVRIDSNTITADEDLILNFAGKYENDNALISALENPNCSNLSDCLKGNITKILIQGLRAAAPFFMLLFQFVLFLLVCIPCQICRCARAFRLWLCCAEPFKPRRLTSCKQMGYLSGAFLCSSLGLISGFYALHSIGQLSFGIRSLNCHLPTFLNNVFNGDPEASAISSPGIFSIAQVLAKIEFNLKDLKKGYFATDTPSVLNSSLSSILKFNRGLRAMLQEAPPQVGVFVKGENFDQIVYGLGNLNFDKISNVLGLFDGISKFGEMAGALRGVFEGMLNSLDYLTRGYLSGSGIQSGNLNATVGACMAVVVFFFVPFFLMVVTIFLGFRESNLEKPKSSYVPNVIFNCSCCFNFCMLSLATVLMLLGYLASLICVLLGDPAYYAQKMIHLISNDSVVGENVVVLFNNCLASSGSGDFAKSIKDFSNRTLFDSSIFINEIFNEILKEESDFSVLNSFQVAPLVGGLYKTCDNCPELANLRGKLPSDPALQNLVDEFFNGGPWAASVDGSERPIDKWLAIAGPLAGDVSNVSAILETDSFQGPLAPLFENLQWTLKNDFVCFNISSNFNNESFPCNFWIWQNLVTNFSLELGGAIYNGGMAWQNFFTIDVSPSGKFNTLLRYPLNNLMSQNNCTFIRKSFLTFTESACLFCGAAMIKLSIGWILMAFFVWGYIVLEFLIWRRMVDQLGFLDDQRRRRSI